MKHPPLRGLNWAYVILGAADATVLPFIPVYLYARGLDAAQIGAVLAASAVTSLVAGMGWAYLADYRIRPESGLLIGAGSAGLVSLLLPWATTPAALFVVTTVLLLARSPFALLDPLTLGRLREQSRTRYARIRLRMSAGWAVCAVLAGGLYQVAGLQLMPFVYAPAAAIFGLWVWRALPPDPNAHAKAASGLAGASRLPRIPITMFGLLFACLLLGVSSAAAQNFVTLSINILGGGALLVGAAAAFQALTEIPTMGSTHLLTKRFSHKALFGIGCGIYGAVFLAWGFTSSPIVMALLKLVVGGGFALTFVAAVLIADDISPSHLRATSQALTKSVMFGLAPIAGTFGGGVIYAQFGPRPMFVASAAVMGAAWLAGLVLINVRHSPDYVPLSRAKVGQSPDYVPSSIASR